MPGVCLATTRCGTGSGKIRRCRRTRPHSCSRPATPPGPRSTSHADHGGDYGLIHADVLRENLLDDAGRLWLIDFDDCGFGFRLYDLATALSQSLDEPQLPGLAAALLDGYGESRRLPPQPGQWLTLFVLLRCLASCGWPITRSTADDPRMRPYATRALRLARLYLDGDRLTA